MPVADLANFLHRLETESIDSLLAELCTPAPESPLAGMRSWIDECFAFDSVAEILEALDRNSSPEAHATADLIRTKSPSAVAVTLEAIRRAATLTSVEEALEAEFAISCYLMYQHDAIEGIRALIVDKDRNPQWQRPANAQVTREYIEAAFEPSAYGTLGLLT
jgi:enoyl-CoA hydratase